MCIEICRNETNICGRGCYVVLQVYLVDYGLAAHYTCDGQHRVYKENPCKAHDGTLEFTSHDAHNGAGKQDNTHTHTYLHKPSGPSHDR